MPALPLNPDQLADAARLKGLFKQLQAARKDRGEQASQEWASGKLGFNQSALNQYLNGKIPLNPDAAAKFAGLLGCEVSDFSAAISKTIRELASTAGTMEEPQSSAPVPMRRSQPTWPFAGIDLEKIRRLNADDTRKLEGAFLLAAAQIQIDIRSEVLVNRKQA